VLSGLRRRGFAGRIILGGPQVSYTSEGLEALYPDADLFIRGYGEAALCEVTSTSGRGDVRGVHWAGQEDKNEQAQVSLEALPSPWLEGVIPLQGQRFVRWETQRGCPYRCSFCQHREAGSRLKHRTLDPARVMRELDLFCDVGVQDIAVLDPIFNVGPQATRILERLVERGYKGKIALQCRAETIKDDFLAAAEKLDAWLEFGLQTIHDNEGTAIERKNQVDKVDKTLAEVRRRGIKHEVSLIFGLPEQTLASFEETVAWCLERRVPVIKAFPLLLLRGTALERDAARWGLQTSGGAMPMVVESHTLTRPQWEEMTRLSEALRQTEGRHPHTLAELRALARRALPDYALWQSSAA
jgi:radical SAM superfamily enzyme YgiQ (UPF0313 family)